MREPARDAGDISVSMVGDIENIGKDYGCRGYFRKQGLNPSSTVQSVQLPNYCNF